MHPRTRELLDHLHVERSALRAAFEAVPPSLRARTGAGTQRGTCLGAYEILTLLGIGGTASRSALTLFHNCLELRDHLECFAKLTPIGPVREQPTRATPGCSAKSALTSDASAPERAPVRGHPLRFDARDRMSAVQSSFGSVRHPWGAAPLA